MIPGVNHTVRAHHHIAADVRLLPDGGVNADARAVAKGNATPETGVALHIDVFTAGSQHMAGAEGAQPFSAEAPFLMITARWIYFNKLNSYF